MEAMERSSDQQAKRYRILIAAIALLLSLTTVFLVWRVQRFVKTLDDAYAYGAVAQNLLDKGYAPLGKLTRRDASLYPAFIALIYLLTGGSQLAVKIAQCGVFAGTCLLAFDIGKRLFNLRTGLIAGLFCALNPMMLRYIPDLHMETLLTFAMTLTVWCTVRFHAKPTIANAILLGAVGILTTLMKAVGFPYLFVFAGIWLWLQLRQRRQETAFAEAAVPRAPNPYLTLAAMFLTMALILAPWTARNYRVTGRFILIAPGLSDSFLRGYIFTKTDYALLRLPPYTYAENECNNWFKQICRDAGTVWELDDVTDDKTLGKVAKQMIVTQPLNTVRKIVVGLFTFWYQMTSRMNSLFAALHALAAWTLAIVGWRRSRREGRPAWLLFAPILTMNLFVATLISLGRYSVPILPCLLVLAAFGVDTLLGGSASKESSAANERA